MIGNFHCIFERIFSFKLIFLPLEWYFNIFHFVSSSEHEWAPKLILLKKCKYKDHYFSTYYLLRQKIYSSQRWQYSIRGKREQYKNLIITLPTLPTYTVNIDMTSSDPLDTRYCKLTDVYHCYCHNIGSKKVLEITEQYMRKIMILLLKNLDKDERDCESQ